MECWKGWTNGPAGCFLDQDQANLRRQSREDEQLEPFRRQAAQQNAHQGAEQRTAVSDSNCGVMERQASALSRAKRLGIINYTTFYSVRQVINWKLINRGYS